MRQLQTVAYETCDTNITWSIGAAGAQVPYKHKVAGSNPASTTIEIDLLIVCTVGSFLYTQPYCDMRHIETKAHCKNAHQTQSCCSAESNNKGTVLTRGHHLHLFFRIPRQFLDHFPSKYMSCYDQHHKRRKRQPISRHQFSN